MKTKTRLYHCLLASVCCLFLLGCESAEPCSHHVCSNGGACLPGAGVGPACDRPFPLGQVTDAFWDTQQTNAMASDFIFYDHEFVLETTKLTPLGEKHLQQVALRLNHVPFPVVVEESVDNKKPKLDADRRLAIIQDLARLGVCQVDRRVVVARAFGDGISAVEGEAAYYQTLSGGGAGFGGTGAFGTFGGFGGGIY